MSVTPKLIMCRHDIHCFHLIHGEKDCVLPITLFVKKNLWLVHSFVISSGTNGLPDQHQSNRQIHDQVYVEVPRPYDHPEPVDCNDLEWFGFSWFGVSYRDGADSR